MNGSQLHAAAQDLCEQLEAAQTPSEVHRLTVLMLGTPGATNTHVTDCDGITVRLVQVAGVAKRRTAGVTPAPRPPLPPQRERGARHIRRTR
jgi:hypothetical protein